MRNLIHLYKQDLPHRAVAVYIYLADRANKQEICWPAIPTIASAYAASPDHLDRRN